MCLFLLAGNAGASPPPVLLKINGTEQAGGFISSCWKEENETPMLCEDSFSINTAAEPLLTRSPFTAYLTVPLREPPEEFGVSVAQVTDKNELNKGDTKSSRSWNIEGNEWSSYSVSLGHESDINISLAPGLYVFNVFAKWKENGDVSYVFLVHVYDPEAKVSNNVSSVEKSAGFEAVLAISILLAVYSIRGKKR
jgi:hypothetical protein